MEIKTIYGSEVMISVFFFLINHDDDCKDTVILHRNNETSDELNFVLNKIMTASDDYCRTQVVLLHLRIFGL